jgi:hemolysin activation/secretion protein
MAATTFLQGAILKLKLLTIAMLALSQGAFAQQPPAAGGQLQQIPPPPVPQKPVPDVRIEPGNVPSSPADTQGRIMVNSLRVSDAHVFSEADLVAVAGFKPGTELSLSELRAMAVRIADYYHRNGYFVAQAYLPAQDIKEGAVTIAVIEGRYGKVTVRNEARVPDSLPNGLLAGVDPGDTIAIGPLENRLLLLSDVPGIAVKSTLVPGASVGTSDLIVDVTPGRGINGSVEADNAGNRYTGEYRVGGTVNFNNPTGHGDVITLRGLTSGSGLNYGRISYQAPVGKATLGVAYTALEYKLGEEFEPLHAHGTARIASVYGSYPLIRSRNTNLYAVLDYDDKTFQDRVDLTSSVTDRKAHVVMGGLHGNHRDNIGGGGLSTGSVTLSSGEIDIITPRALADDAATARTNGGFHKVGFTASRLQTVTERISLYGAISGQVASKNLDISEKMGLGGAYGVRAYPVGEAYADEGYLATVEARLLLPKAWETMRGQMHLIGFVDTGTVTINKNPWAAGPNTRTLSGGGIGVSWAEYNNFVARAFWAQKIGNETATSAPDKNGRLWFQLIKYF